MSIKENGRDTASMQLECKSSKKMVFHEDWNVALIVSVLSTLVFFQRVIRK